MNANYLASIKKQFLYYKLLGEKAIEQVPEEKLFWVSDEESNSIAMIVKHLWGNMLSRWTDFLSSDGEKPWRNRDAEFENDIQTKSEMMQKWDDGWDCLLNTLNSLQPEDLERMIYIRNEGHTVLEAINRQLAHYPYHVGQIVFLARMLREGHWKSLSIARNQSSQYNQGKFAQGKTQRHFTDEWLNK